METEIQEVKRDLAELKNVVSEMKEYMEDCFLTAEEEEAVEKARGEFERGETISHEELKKELEL